MSRSQRIPGLSRKVVARPCGGLRLFRVLGSAGSSRHTANRRGGRSPCTTESRRSKGDHDSIANACLPPGPVRPVAPGGDLSADHRHRDCIEISFERKRRARTRTIRITATLSHAAQENVGAHPSASSAPSATVLNPNPANGFAAPLSRTVATDADGTGGR